MGAAYRWRLDSAITPTAVAENDVITSAGMVDKSWICCIGFLLCFANGSDGKEKLQIWWCLLLT